MINIIKTYKKCHLLLALLSFIALSAQGELAKKNTDIATVASATIKRELYGPIADAETPWFIAKRFRPSKTVSVHQTVVAIFILNPTAFTNNNINRMIKGSYLTLPTLKDVNAVSAENAMAILSGQIIEPTLNQNITSSPEPKPASVLEPVSQLEQKQSPEKKEMEPKTQVPVNAVSPSAPTAIQQTKAPLNAKPPLTTDTESNVKFWASILGFAVISCVAIIIFFAFRVKKVSIATQNDTETKVPQSPAIKEDTVEQLIKAEAVIVEDLAIKDLALPEKGEPNETTSPQAINHQTEKVKPLVNIEMPEFIEIDPNDDYNSTKLELAKAYLNIGDKQGANALLNEVIDEGNEQQVSTANQLFNS